jgi:glutamate-1-semialdehyde 2,1-aminomutase
MPVGAYGGRRKSCSLYHRPDPFTRQVPFPEIQWPCMPGMHFCNICRKILPYTIHWIKKTAEICGRIKEKSGFAFVGFTINRVGSMFTLFFNPDPVQNFEDARKSDLKAFGNISTSCSNRGFIRRHHNLRHFLFQMRLERLKLTGSVTANLLALKGCYIE